METAHTTREKLHNIHTLKKSIMTLNIKTIVSVLMPKTSVHINSYLREILLTILEPLLTSASVSLNCECVWRKRVEGGVVNH